VPKYNGETNPDVWLEDYRLACRTGGATSDFFIIRHLPLYLADPARAWLEHLPAGRIDSWADLRDVFIGNFQGTYARPGNPWDLRSCRQKKDESLRDYIRRFSKQCTESPHAADADVISAFSFGTRCKSLIHKLGRKKPRTTKELLDLATDHADGEEAVAAILTRPRRDDQDDDDVPETSSGRQKRKGKAKRRRDGDLVAAADRRAQKPRDGQKKDHFEKLLESPCTNHEGPVQHKLKDCRLLKNFLDGTLKRGAPKPNEGKDDAPIEGDDAAYFEDGRVMMIFGGPDAYGSKRQQKLTRRDVCSAEPAVPTYLKWSNA
jgi:hypothetical protein